MNVEGPQPGYELIRPRRVVAGPLEARFRLRPGERPLVGPGEAVVRGAPLAERIRDPRTAVVASAGGASAKPGSWWTAAPGRRSRGDGAEQGELLFRSGGRWRIAAGDPAQPLEAPFGGIVRDVQPGTGLTLRTPARGLLGLDVLAGPSTGHLHVLAGRDGHVRASQIDVGAAGAILVVGSHVDAEAITRARAVGVRGIVVAGLGVKERREVVASEQRSQAGAHGLPPFAILVLEGAIGRPIASPFMAVLEVLEGRMVAIIDEPACLAIEDPDLELPRPAPLLVRVTAGPLAGFEGSWAGLAGRHRFAGNVLLEAGLVRFGGRAPVAVPLGDLERFV